MLSFLLRVGVLRGIWQASVGTEHEMAHSDLIVPVNSVDHLSMIKDIESEETFLVFEVLAVFSQPNVESGGGVVRANKELFLENDPILRGDILVCVLKRLNLLTFFQIELGSVRNQLKLKLVALGCGVIGWDALNYDGVALSSVGLKDEVLKLHHIEDSLTLGLCGIPLGSVPSVYQAEAHVL